MGSRNPQTMAKRAREQALKERRERKRAKKAALGAERAADKHELRGGDSDDRNSSARPRLAALSVVNASSAPIHFGICAGSSLVGLVRHC
jgi:hypothetical protein